MRTRANVLAVGLAAMMMSACVSTTSGPSKPEADNQEAARQYYSLGARYFNNGQYEIAKERLLHSLEFDSKSAITHSVLAMTYQQLDIPRLAAEHFDLSLRYEPRNIDVRNNYAVFLCQQRDFDEAVDQFERIVKIRENDYPKFALTNAGVCVGEKPDLVAAEKYFRRALGEKANYGEALLQMALLKRQVGDALSARAFLQRYLVSNPASASILYLAIQIENDIGNARASTDYTNQLLREFPASAEARQLTEAG